MRTNKKIFSTRSWVLAVLLATVVLGPLSARAADDSCANASSAGNSKDQATPLNAAGGVCGGVLAGADIWYKLTLNNPAQFELAFAQKGEVAVLYPPGATTGLASTGTIAGVNQPEWRLRAKAGDWYLQFKGANQFGEYAFAYTVVEQHDCGTVPQDAPNSSSTQVIFATECAGQLWGFPGNQLSKIDTDDWYQMLGLTGGSPVTIELGATQDRTIGCTGAVIPTCGSEDFSGVKIEIRNASGSTVLLSDSVPDGAATQKQISFNPPADGDYLLRLFSNGDYGYFIAKAAIPSVGVPSVVPSIPSIPPSGLPSIPPSIPPVPGADILMNDCYPATGDAGNDSSHARPIGTQVPATTAIGAACIGHLGDGDGEDWYSFFANKGQHLIMALTGDGNLNPDVSIQDPGGVIRMSGSATAVPALVQGDITSGGTWKMRVSRHAGTGNYLMLMSVTDLNVTNVVPSSLPVPSTLPNPLNGDCNTGADAPNDNNSTPPRMPSNNACAGSLGTPSTDTNDWYTFQGYKNQDVGAILLAEDTLDPNLDLYTPGGTHVFPPNHFPSPEPEYFRYTLTESGLWRLRLSKVTGGGKYLLLLGSPEQLAPSGLPSTIPSGIPSSIPSIPPTPIPSSLPGIGSGDCNTGGDAGNTIPSATRINPPTGCTGTIGASDTDDFYAFNAVSGQRISVIESAEPALDADIYLYTPYGERIDGAHGGPQPESVATIAGQDGTYVLRVRRGGGSGEYGFGIYVGNGG